LKPARIPAAKHTQTIAALPNDVFGNCAAQMRNQSSPKHRAAGTVVLLPPKPRSH